MLMKDILLEEYKEVIDTVLKATKLPRNNEQSRNRISDLLVRSMGLTNSKEPSLCPVYLLAVAIHEYAKSNAWPARLPDFVIELQGLTSLSYSTIRSSIEKFDWDIPIYLKPKPKKKIKQEPVSVLSPIEAAPTKEAATEDKSHNEAAAHKYALMSAFGLATEDTPKPVESIKLTDNYHVVIDFGAFKITIEREGNGK